MKFDSVHSLCLWINKQKKERKHDDDDVDQRRWKSLVHSKLGGRRKKFQAIWNEEVNGEREFGSVDVTEIVFACHIWLRPTKRRNIVYCYL